MSVLSDTEIMTRVQAGETSLFGELVARYRSRLLRFAASKSGNVETAEDLVQDAFLAAYQARDSYSSEFAFSTWIWTILLNLSRQDHRRRLRRTELVSRYAQQQGQHGSIFACPNADQLVEEEQQIQLHEWLNQISDEEADALRLRFFGGLKYEEIALAMDSSLSGAKVRVKRGLQRLAELAKGQ